MTELESPFLPRESDLESLGGDPCDFCLEESQLRFKTTFENAAVGIALVAPDGRFLMTNARLSEIVGYSAQDLAARTFHDITHADDLAADLAQRQRMLSDAISTYSMEKRYIRKDGRAIWVNLTVGKVKKADGSVDYFITMVEDIAKRREAETRLKESEERLRRILDNLFAFVGVLTRDGVLADVNRAPMIAANLSRADVIGKPFWDCYWWSFSEASRERLRNAFSRALQGETVRYDVDARVGEGRFVTTDFQLAPLRNAQGEVHEFVASATDITERRRVEAKLRESEADLHLAQDAANLGRWAWDLRSDELSWTDRCKALFGLQEQAAVTFPMFLARLHPEDREKVDAAVKAAIRLRTDYDVEMRALWPDGSLHWVASKGRVYFEDGAPSRMVGVAFDITSRKQAEEQMSYALREVDHRAKNLLSLVQAIARQTARTETAGEFVELFSERLRGLAASHDLLVGNRWKGVALLDLARSQLSHFKDALGSRVRLNGPAVELNAPAAQTIGMAIHELATNAAKYGALGNESGAVLIDWAIEGDRFVMSWSEHGGPPVATPSRKGFGQTVLVRMAQDALDAEVSLEYKPAGLEWRLACAAKNALEG
ncbi:MAG: PAS domain S-box protein [Rhodomicrobium sp.]|jgi:PAS domain S-box-containing protein